MTKKTTITFLTSLGAGLEYYDYVIYTLLAGYLSLQFFPATNHNAALFATFSVFAIGNIIRPIGGIIFGIFSDKYGRKSVFASTLLWMAFATFLMGIAPGFASIGIGATIIFSLLRILQGIACGAEIPGAMTFLIEHINTRRVGLHFGFMVSSIGLGVSFGSLVIYVLTKILTEPELQSFGFRIPFLLGGTLAVIGFLIRRRVDETPAFLQAQQKKEKFNFALLANKTCWKQIFITLGILVFPASLITFKLVLPVYLKEIYHYQSSDIYLILTIGYVWSTLLLPIAGWLSDYINKKYLLFTAQIIAMIFAPILFNLLYLHTKFALLGFIMIWETLIAIMAASYFVLLPQSFKTIFRYTGTAFSYNIAYSLASLFPLAINYFYKVEATYFYAGLSFSLLAAISFCSTIILKTETVDVDAESNSRLLDTRERTKLDASITKIAS